MATSESDDCHTSYNKLSSGFAIALYHGHLWVNEKKFELNSEIPVTSLTSPTLLIQAEDDKDDSIHHSFVYYRALKDAKDPVEMHLFDRMRSRICSEINKSPNKKLTSSGSIGQSIASTAVGLCSRVTILHC